MKTKLLIFLFFPFVLYSQEQKFFDIRSIYTPDLSVIHIEGWVVDSVKWVTHDTVFSAKRQCKHSWVFRSDSSSSLHGGFLTDVSKQNEPPFWQQDKSDATWFYNNRSKICRTCLTEVAEHLVKYWHYAPPPKSEFEILKDRQKSLAKVKHKYSSVREDHTPTQYRVAWYLKADSTRSGYGEWDSDSLRIAAWANSGNARFPEVYHFVERKR